MFEGEKQLLRGSTLKYARARLYAMYALKLLKCEKRMNILESCISFQRQAVAFLCVSSDIRILCSLPHWTGFTSLILKSSNNIVGLYISAPKL